MSGLAIDTPPASAAGSAPARTDPLEVRFSIPGGMPLHHGGQLAHVDVACRLYGAAEAPVVAVMGGISAGRRVADTHDELGWWGEVVGPGLPLDTGRFRVLGVDFLGGSHDTTGPQGDFPFPTISTFDQAEVLRSVLDHLGIPELHACVGASYGGMVALALAGRYPARVDRVVAISAAHRAHPMSTAWRSVQRAIVRYALSHRDAALALSREVTHAKPDDPRPAYIFDDAVKHRAVDPDLPIPVDKLKWTEDLLVKTGNATQPVDIAKVVDVGVRKKALALAGK
jgi:homoserine O-acetyltransferase